MTDNHSEIWETYTTCWSNPNEVERKEMLSKVVEPDCVYSDPTTTIAGIDNLSAYMAQFQQGFPGITFATTNFTVHHDQSLTHWDMVNNEGTILGKGISFGMYKNGKLVKMTGFF